MANHPYVTYFNSPIQIGTGIDNISTPDAGNVLLEQSANINLAAATGSGTSAITIPVGARIIAIRAVNNTGSVLVGAGTLAITLGSNNLGSNPFTGNYVDIMASLSPAQLQPLYSLASGQNVLTATATGIETSTAEPVYASGILSVTVSYKLAVTP